MKDKKPIRDQWLTIRLSNAEATALLKYARKTTCRSLSEYGRSVLLQEPVIVRYRNASADDFLAEMVALKKELHAIGNNFNQAVRRMHTLDQTGALQHWLVVTENQRATLLQKTDEILQKAVQIHLLWSQK